MSIVNVVKEEIPVSYTVAKIQDPPLSDQEIAELAMLGTEVCDNLIDLENVFQSCAILIRELGFDRMLEYLDQYKECLHFVVNTLYPDNLDKERSHREVLKKITKCIAAKAGYQEAGEDSELMYWLIDQHPDVAVNLFERYGNAAKGLVYSMKRSLVEIEEGHSTALMLLYKLSAQNPRVFYAVEPQFLRNKAQKTELLKLARATKTDFIKVMNLKGSDSLHSLNDAIGHYGSMRIFDILNFTDKSLKEERRLRKEIGRHKEEFLSVEGCTEDDFFMYLEVIGAEYFEKMAEPLFKSVVHFKDETYKNFTEIMRYLRAFDRVADDDLKKYADRFPKFVKALAKIAGPRTANVLSHLRFYETLRKPNKALELLRELFKRGPSVVEDYFSQNMSISPWKA